ncbi:MAG: electron transport complex subunit RsxD [Candidatus Thiodiazotropha sp. (ex Lucinoma borealis)]|nr:electron transport complex subunit RsxD [Candidatus Thiodiazotropha sp. (ex Lucinoma borealis)]MCU7862493.1 electron transport complex subunit RsxD [Candidatus Thiodiazotropha sp. (ex Lucinoma borealis)]MCU7869299.1 electron transport complex subunit RsxD [Candidatus Thiodiazotropha sp. (ex Lucinoma borealis)]MCU7948389.1 electron transport complex subunit RsxD [Candidatus Thiodiazotropha sp. (ex Cardiolucina cf. quadrata)]
MEFHTLSSPHTKRVNRVDKVMLQVVLALIPGITAMIFYFGWGVLINAVLAILSAVAFEAMVIRLRKRPVMPVLFDLSAVVTALLFAVAIPPLLPWWLVVMGMAFAIIMVKQMYGGLGYNPFNPAMAAYVLLLISYPVEMTSWMPPYLLADHHLTLPQILTFKFSGVLPGELTLDAITMATPLDQMRTNLDLNSMISEIRQSPLWGDFGGLGWEWVGNWFLMGGIWMVYKRTITWQIPLAFLTGLVSMATIFWLFDAESFPFPLFHVFSGGVILGAFFIATDPVTACTTRAGQLIFGAAIGVLVYLIRTWGGYPDAVAFAVLLMNMAAPTIDYYTRPRTYGHGEVKSE